MFDERRRLSSREKKNRSVSLSLSPLLFFFWLCFFWLSFLSLEVFLSQEECVSVSLSPAILMNLREVFRERHFAAQKRARAREKRQTEREKETRERERERVNQHSLPTEVSLLCSFSPPLPRGIKPHRRNIPFSRLRRKTENSRVFPGKPSS